MIMVHDRQTDLRLLDETRRFYMKRGPLLTAVVERVNEMRDEKVRLSTLIETALVKYDVPKEKGLARLAQIQPYEQLNSELHELVLSYNAIQTLDDVLSGYESLLSITSNENCTGVGSIIAKPAAGDTDIGISASEYRSIFTPFDAKAFAAALAPSFPAPSTMGVGTALRSHHAFGRPQSAALLDGYMPPDATVGIDSLKE